MTPSGIGLGLTENTLFSESLENKSIKPAKNDVFVTYTDGLVETRNKKNVEFGEESLQNIVCCHAGLSKNEIKDNILTEISRFRGTVVPHDDLTLVVLKYTGD